MRAGSGSAARLCFRKRPFQIRTVLLPCSIRTTLLVAVVHGGHLFRLLLSVLPKIKTQRLGTQSFRLSAVQETLTDLFSGGTRRKYTPHST